MKESILCFNTHGSICNHDYRTLEMCLGHPNFNVNERFPTCEREDENFLCYALLFNNFYAASRLLDCYDLKLSLEEKQRLLEILKESRHYIQYMRIVKRLEENRLPFTKILGSMVSGKYPISK